MTPRRLAAGTLRAALGLCAVVASGCGCESAPAMREPVSTTMAVLQVAGLSVRVDLQLDQPARNRGLMGRTHLADGEGMLFVFPTEDMLHFYMRNTLIPLDIVFLQTDGTVINVTQGTPGVELPTCDSARPARMVLELNAGWAEKHGLRPGDRVDVPPHVLPLAR